MRGLLTLCRALAAGQRINNNEGVLTAKARTVVYVGEPVPELNEQEHAAFFMNMQKSILLSLEKRNLLTSLQRERCLLEIEKQYNNIDY